MTAMMVWRTTCLVGLLGLSILILTEAVPVFVSKPKHGHVVPTYFRRQDKNGKLINSQGSEYGQDISLPIDEEISESDLQTAALKVHPFAVKNGDMVTVSWSGISNPSGNDWIAIICPWNDKIERRLDHFYVSSCPTWKLGYGSQKVHVYNMRSQCEFRYFRNNANSKLVAVSNILGFQFGAKAPLQGRIALTGNPTEMRVMWTAAKSENSYPL